MAEITKENVSVSQQEPNYKYVHTVTHKLTVSVHCPLVRAPANLEIWTAGKSTVAGYLQTEGRKIETKSKRNVFSGTSECQNYSSKQIMEKLQFKHDR